MGRPRRGGAFPSVAGVRVGYVVRRLASPNALHDVFGVFDAVRRLFPESDLVSFYGLLVLLRYLDLGHTPPFSVCARTRRWGLVGDSAVHVAMRPYSSPLSLSPSSLSLSSSVMGAARDCPSIGADKLLVQHLAQHRGEAARVREVVRQGLGLRRRVVDGASRLVGHGGFSFRVAAESCRFVGRNMVTTHNIAAYCTST